MFNQIKISKVIHPSIKKHLQQKKIIVIDRLSIIYVEHILKLTSKYNKKKVLGFIKKLNLIFDFFYVRL